NIREMITNLVTLAQYQLPSTTKLEFSIDGDEIVTLPQQGLHQALLNLIVNASQAITEDDGHIKLEISHSANEINISVEDNGTGFPDEMLKSRVQPFMTWKDNGTGLGMAIVRRFIQSLNGQLTMENVSPHGARVTLNLPC
ncbi:MAG: ATP-binding protein, partial [Gammaproteobacteria bacterium]|nr:ATP-binding protein [Gammaproteobacteria bacterium]